MTAGAAALDEQIRLTQDKCFELIQIVDRICREANIAYWIDGGTLLGAKRHGGFIPWDDDMDICIPIHDYDRLIELLADYCATQDTKILFFHKAKFSYWCEFFGDTTLLMDGVFPVHIDICPVKSIPKTIGAAAIDRSLTDIARYYLLGALKYPEETLPEHKGYLEVGNDPEAAKNAFFAYFYAYCLETSLKVRESGESDYYLSYMYNDSVVGRRNRPYHESLEVYPLGQIVFSGYSFNCPGAVDPYLTKLYGDYMQLPPADQQVPHQRVLLANKRFSPAELQPFINEVYGVSLKNLALGKTLSNQMKKLSAVTNSVQLMLSLTLRGKFSMARAVMRYSYLQFVK